MNEIESQTENLIDTIRKSNEYMKYQQLYEDIKLDTNLLQRLNEFRKKTYAIQLEKEGNSLYICKQLREEYKDILVLKKVHEFLVSEQNMRKILQKINHDILDNIDLKIDFI